MLKMNDVKLELISGIDKHLINKQGLSGGIYYICKGFSEANNKCMKHWYYKKK